MKNKERIAELEREVESLKRRIEELESRAYFSAPIILQPQRDLGEYDKPKITPCRRSIEVGDPPPNPYSTAVPVPNVSIWRANTSMGVLPLNNQTYQSKGWFPCS